MWTIFGRYVYQILNHCEFILYHYIQIGCFNCKVVILFAWFTSVLEANCMFLVVSSSFPHSEIRKRRGNEWNAQESFVYISVFTMGWRVMKCAMCLSWSAPKVDMLVTTFNYVYCMIEQCYDSYLLWRLIIYRVLPTHKWKFFCMSTKRWVETCKWN